MDEEGNRYSIPVTACADNCLITNQAFLEVRSLVDECRRLWMEFVATLALLM